MSDNPPTHAPTPQPDGSRTVGVVTCGVVVTDGTFLVIGHATGMGHWDIPKGRPEPGEALRDTALRELGEETGLTAQSEELVPLGRYRLRSGLHLELFLLARSPVPSPDGLVCHSHVTKGAGAPFPELDRFALATWDALDGLVTDNMARCLHEAEPLMRAALAPPTN